MVQFPPISLALAGLEHPGATDASGVRELFTWAKGLGVQGVQLNGAAAGLRARELDRSGRRDLAAAMKRAGLGFSGIDLWVPPEHFADPARAERAASAVCEAIELSAEIAGLMGAGVCPVSITLSRVKGEPPVDVSRVLIAHADRFGGRVADCTYPWSGNGPSDRQSPLGVGLDPAAVLMAGGDPVREAGALGPGLVAARLSDCQSAGRTAFGGPDGRVDPLAYGVGLSASGGGGGPAWVVFDGRGVRDPAHGIAGAVSVWGPRMPG
ncbi:MAG: hypothetical protein ACT4PL_12530 [Phycisphaerales bacterium]